MVKIRKIVLGFITIIVFSSLIMSCSNNSTPKNEVVAESITFPDKNLENAVRKAINKKKGNILKTDVEKVISLNFTNENITDISGIENFTDLSELSLSNNKISNIELLKGLNNLAVLSLQKNKITSIEPLAALTNLTDLSLSYNYEISSLEPLVGLSNLRYLDLSSNKISNIEPLKTLTKLRVLYLAANEIKDFSPVKSYYSTLKDRDFTLP